MEERTDEQIQDGAYRAVLAAMVALEAHWKSGAELLEEHSSELDFHQEFLMGMDEPHWAANDHLLEAIHVIHNLLIDAHPTLEQQEKFLGLSGYLDRFSEEQRRP